MPLSFPLGLIRRLVKGSPITFAEEDGNKDIVEEALETLDNETVKTADLVSLTDLPGAPTGTDEIMVMRGGVPYKETLTVVKAYLTSTAPAAFVAGNWTATAGVGSIEVNITALPSDGGSAITALQYRLNGGAAVAFTGTGTGIRTISGLTGGVSYDVEIRAVNENGAGAWSDIKARTPTSASSFSAAYVTNLDTAFVNGAEFQNPKVFTGLSIGAADATRKLYVYLFQRFGSLTDAVTLSVNGGGAITPLASVRVGSNRQIFLFVADVPTGTTANFSFASGGADLNNAAMAVIRAVGAHTAATQPYDDFGTAPAIAIATNAGDSIFMGAMFNGDGGAGFFTPPAGFTEHFDTPTRPSVPAQPAALFGGTAAGGAPETFTAGVSDGAGTSALLLRLRAS